jgi:hypothetical protein
VSLPKSKFGGDILGQAELEAGVQPTAVLQPEIVGILAILTFAACRSAAKITPKQ